MLRHCLGFQPLISVTESCRRKFIDKLLDNGAFNVLVKVYEGLISLHNVIYFLL